MSGWLAEKENASDLIGGVGDVSLDDKDALLAHVLLDLSMDANRSASIEAGTAVLGRSTTSRSCIAVTSNRPASSC